MEKCVWGTLGESVVVISCINYKIHAYKVYYLSKRCDQKSLLNSGCELVKCHFTHIVKQVPPQANRWEQQLEAQSASAEPWPCGQCCMEPGQQRQQHLVHIAIPAQPLGLPALKSSLAGAALVMAKWGNATCEGQRGQAHSLSSCSLHWRDAGLLE